MPAPARRPSRAGSVVPRSRTGCAAAVRARACGSPSEWKAQLGRSAHQSRNSSSACSKAGGVAELLVLGRGREVDRAVEHHRAHAGRELLGVHRAEHGAVRVAEEVDAAARPARRGCDRGRARRCGVPTSGEPVAVLRAMHAPSTSTWCYAGVEAAEFGIVVGGRDPRPTRRSVVRSSMQSMGTGVAGAARVEAHDVEPVADRAGHRVDARAAASRCRRRRGHRSSRRASRSARLVARGGRGSARRRLCSPVGCRVVDRHGRGRRTRSPCGNCCQRRVGAASVAGCAVAAAPAAVRGERAGDPTETAATRPTATWRCTRRTVPTASWRSWVGRTARYRRRGGPPA